MSRAISKSFENGGRLLLSLSCLILAFAMTPRRARATESGGLREPAPRPIANVRVQPRLFPNEGKWHAYGGVAYYERRDYYVSPGLELGLAHSLTQSLALGLRAHHFFSSLNDAAADVARKYGVLPDTLPAAWMVLADLRYDLGYGKILIEGLHSVLHFEPQLVVGAGVHVNGGQLGPTGLLGLGLAFHVTPVWFVRVDGAVAFDGEEVRGNPRLEVGFLPSLTGGGSF